MISSFYLKKCLGCRKISEQPAGLFLWARESSYSFASSLSSLKQTKAFCSLPLFSFPLSACVHNIGFFPHKTTCQYFPKQWGGARDPVPWARDPDLWSVAGTPGGLTGCLWPGLRLGQHSILQRRDVVHSTELRSAAKLVFSFKRGQKGVFSKNFKLIFIFKWLTKSVSKFYI